MGLFKTIAEGGQIWAHRVRMLRQVCRVAIIVSLVLGTVFLAIQMLRIPSVYYKAAFYYGKAHFLGGIEKEVAVSSEFWAETGHPRYAKKTILVKTKHLERTCEKQLETLWKITCENLNKSFRITFSTFCITVFCFLLKGWRSRKTQHIKGQQKVAPWRVALQLKLHGKASPLALGSLPLVKGTESQHILISGSTGSGKSNAYHHLLPQMRKSGQRAVIVDTTGEFVAKYFREGKDVLLNPFDQRSAKWHPWCECHDSYDFKSLAQSFIPTSYNEEDNFWRKAAQEVFCSLLTTKAAEAKPSQLVKSLLYDPLPLLSDTLKNTKAAAFLDTTSEKTAGSIRAVAVSFLECLEILEDTQGPFSIRDWVHREDQDSWLFLTCTTGQRASLTPLLSAWYSIAMRSLLQMAPKIDRRLWFIVDELPSLNRLKDLEVCLAESRKFGGCMLLAVQSLAHLEMIYGRDATRIIIGNCATRVAFAEQDPEMAARISKTFGEKQEKEYQEGISYGAHEMRDGVNLSYQTRNSAVISATDIQSLEKLQAFVRLPGNLPITKVKLKYKEVENLCAGFMEIPKQAISI